MSGRVTAVLAVAVLAAGVQVAPAAAGTPVMAAGSGDGWARMGQQRPLVAAATAIRWEVERHDYPGYAGIVLEDKAVALWWKGAVPASMSRVITAATRSAPVEVRAAQYSLGELRTAAARFRAGNAGVESVKFQPDGSGLIASMRGGAARAADAGVPVTVVHEPALQPISRDDDWAPWKGGATIVNATRSTACTAGFGVRANGASYLLTAAHCGQTGDRIQDARGEFIGTVGNRNQDHDVALIPTSGVDGYVYVGTPTDGVVSPVEGWGWTFVGEYLCQSGVSSSRELGRPVCNLKVLFYYDDKEDLVEAEQTEGQTAARPGDSGGPIYSVSASGKLVAKGTTTRVAGARIGFQDYGTAWRDFGITPATR
ncbi:trypsin-like serine protease [Symbioplanes lichenis]|uniref:trypsin-like serine protease n=1 Tax=Symbioplanes lichenis TaxID=1629072 RepID=UPI00273A415B|nr:trypsin-like serine protease [Actinoplanes lichenis]